jgi:hypothetical protein
MFALVVELAFPFAPLERFLLAQTGEQKSTKQSVFTVALARQVALFQRLT